MREARTARYTPLDRWMPGDRVSAKADLAIIPAVGRVLRVTFFAVRIAWDDGYESDVQPWALARSD